MKTTFMLTHDSSTGKMTVETVPQNKNECKPREEEQTTFYCLFLPLNVYCPFGASNIHHAYNKAARFWGIKGAHYGTYPEFQVIRRQERISLLSADCDKTASKLITATLMTKVVKAWREEN